MGYRRLAGWLLCLFCLGASPVRAAGPVAEMRPFVAGSLARIVSAHQGKPFLLGFWSLDCVHCGAEMQLLKKLKARHPGLEVVLVATDANEDWSNLQAYLQAAGLGRVEQWAFADPVPERLRQEIDRRWYGELPRTYLYGRDGQVTAISGLLSEAALAPWLARNKP